MLKRLFQAAREHVAPMSLQSARKLVTSVSADGSSVCLSALQCFGLNLLCISPFLWSGSRTSIRRIFLTLLTWTLGGFGWPSQTCLHLAAGVDSGQRD